MSFSDRGPRTAGATRTGLSEGVHGAVGRVLDLMPRRKTGYRRVRIDDTAENRRRASIAAIALVAVIVVLGGLVWYLGPFRSDNPTDNTPDGAAALADATEKVNQVSAGDMIHNDPVQAQTLLQGAWDDLKAAQGGVSATA